MGGGSALRTGLAHRDFRVSLTMWVWVDFMVWRREGASREGPGGGGTVFAVCRVRMVCFIWRFGLERVALWRWLWLG